MPPSGIQGSLRPQLRTDLPFNSQNRSCAPSSTYNARVHSPPSSKQKPPGFPRLARHFASPHGSLWLRFTYRPLPVPKGRATTAPPTAMPSPHSRLRKRQVMGMTPALRGYLAQGQCLPMAPLDSFIC